MFLEDYLEQQFNTVLEDGSPDELGEMLCTMWRQCGEGNFTMTTTALAQESARREAIARSQGVDNTGDVMDSDDDEEDGFYGAGDEVAAFVAAAVAGGGGGEAAATSSSMFQQLGGGGDGDGGMMEEEDRLPRVDAEGWETKISKGGRKKKP